jgi:hypothetical protein
MSGITYAGSTLSINSVIGNSYIASFSITNVLLNGSTLTTDPSFWGTGLTFLNGTTASDYLPYGCGGGYLWIVDKNLPESSQFGPNAIAVPTDLTGTTTISFITSIKASYAYNLYYQSTAGVFLNNSGSTGNDIVNLASLTFVAPPISSGGAFEMLNPITTTQSETTANIGSTLFTYNTIPITSGVGTSFSGQVLVYQSPVPVPAFGQTGGVTGTLVGSLSDTYIRSGSGIIPITYGITFDSQLGDFYAIYYPFTGDTLQSSENYVDIPPIYLPFSVGNSDFYGTSGTTAITVELNDIQYNYTPLTDGQQVLLKGPSITQILTATNSSVTFLSYQSTAGDKLYFYNSGITSQNFYSVPGFQYGQEEILGSFSRTDVTNNGFTILLNNFDYLDSNGHSIFNSVYYPTSATGFIRAIGPNNFFQEVPYTSASTYKFVVDTSIPFASSYLPYIFSFVQNSDIQDSQGTTFGKGLLSATDTYNVFWRGVIPTNESLIGNDFVGVSGSTLTIVLNNFDYLDIYGNSIFNSRYLPIEVASILRGGNVFQTAPSNSYNGGSVSAPGGTALSALFNYPTQIPPSGTQLPAPIRGASLAQTDSYYYDGSTGTVFFGVTGTELFAVGTAVYGSNLLDNSLNATVLSSSSSGLVLDVQSATNPTSDSPWTFTGTYYDEPYQGHSGTIQLLNSLGNVITSVLYTGQTGYTLIAGGQSLSNGVYTPYYISFYDGTLGITRSSRLTTYASGVDIIYGGESFIGSISNVTSTSFSLSNFDYLVNGTSVVYPGYTGGFINLYSSPSGSLLYTLGVTGGTGTIYNFDVGTTIPNTSVLKYQNPSVNFFGTSYKSIMSGYPPGSTYFGGWTGGSFQGLSAGSSGVTANLDFSYMYTGSASQSVIYQLIAEVDQGIPVSQTLNVNIPASELSRMLVYQSAWFNIDPNTGLTIQGFIGAPGATMVQYDPATGNQLIYYGPKGLTGPNVALLLESVLGAVNLGTTTSGSYSYGPVDVLGAIDNQFTSQSASAPFQDDAGLTVTPIYGVWQGLTFVSTTSLLSSIPAETIASITNSGMTITSFRSVLKDIDTITTPNSNWVPALANLFAESAAYGRADDKDPISITALAPGSTYYAFHGPSGTTGVTGALGSSIAQNWASTGVNTYGVNFQPGDSLTLYMTYTFSKGRVYTLGATVIQDLQQNYGFSVGNVASLLIGGKSIKLQNLNNDGTVNLSGAATDSTTVDRVIGVKLNAVASDDLLVTRFHP